MAETDTPEPLGDGDIVPPPATTDVEAAAPSKDAGADVASANPVEPAPSGRVADAKQAIGNGAVTLQQQATDKIRLFAEDGKARAGGALEQFAEMLVDAAGQVDEKLGAQYGDYARSAASSIQGLATSVREKDVDELAADVRGYVRKSPAAAVGFTAALGFALARMVHAGLDQRG